MTEIPHVMPIKDYERIINQAFERGFYRYRSNYPFTGCVSDRVYGGYMESDKQFAERIKAQEEKK